jgi:hypothetical protein
MFVSGASHRMLELPSRLSLLEVLQRYTTRPTCPPIRSEELPKDLHRPTSQVLSTAAMPATSA